MKRKIKKVPEIIEKLEFGNEVINYPFAAKTIRIAYVNKFKCILKLLFLL